MSNSKFKTYFIEGLLIIFSVLFALFINKSFEKYQTKQTKKIAKKSILNELYRNESILDSWKKRHIQVRENVTSIIEGEADSLKLLLESEEYLNLGVLTNNQSLVDAVLTNTAWESAKTTGIISEFDYETLQKLTEVYKMQEVVTEQTLINILEFYFHSDAHDMDQLDKNLIQFQLRFWELTGQEETLSGLYDEAKQILTE